MAAKGGTDRFSFLRDRRSPLLDESAYYEFTASQVDELEDATQTLNGMCLNLVDHAIRNNLLGSMGIPAQFHEYVKAAWQQKEPTIYGRFDFSYDGKSEPKLLEFNADTPTALFEASVVQYYWLQDFDPSKDQFNSIHEKLLSLFENTIKRRVAGNTLYFSSVKNTLEDYTTTEYMRDVAMQAGLQTEQLFVEDIGYDHDYGRFVDLADKEITYLFKLYPWEHMLTDPFAEFLSTTDIVLFEPPWKMILSNKAILPILWEMYPNHPNLLPSYFTAPNTLTTFVEKPFFSREGAGIIVDNRFPKRKNR